MIIDWNYIIEDDEAGIYEMSKIAETLLTTKIFSKNILKDLRKLWLIDEPSDDDIKRYVKLDLIEVDDTGSIRYIVPFGKKPSVKDAFALIMYQAAVLAGMLTDQT